MATKKARMMRDMQKVVLLELADDSITEIVRQNVAMLTMIAASVTKSPKEVDPSVHVQNYAEEIVPRYTPWQFHQHFRMFPDTFEELCEWIGPHLQSSRSISVEKKMLATIWLVGNMESFRSVADRFGVNKGSLHRIVLSVCRALTAIRGDVISWPPHGQLQKIANDFQELRGFPGIVGAVDGTYIEIPGTTDEHRAAYICRKGFPAMHLQVVCTADLLFTDVDTGNAGSVHDSRVFRTSDLQAKLESEEGRLPAGFHLLGDSAYGQTEYLLVPFRDNGHLSPVERNYNNLHSSTRVQVERAIGLLKGKFRRLKKLDMVSVRDIPFIIFACDIEDDIELEVEVDVAAVEGEGDVAVNLTAAEKRMSVAELLM
ncbi:putative nuclease HARBI1 [Littorina saxatilis]|uniref:putative nuclease HARBI1 n=1 Tax=Littorina saxatilis TaxID=31220 RepID=UPI0038B4A580